MPSCANNVIFDGLHKNAHLPYNEYYLKGNTSSINVANKSHPKCHELFLKKLFKTHF
jgi:hypothetical protein